MLSFTPTQDILETPFMMVLPAISRDGASVYVGNGDGFDLRNRDLQPGTSTAELPCCPRMVQTMTNGLWAAVVDAMLDSDTSLDPDVWFFTPDGEVVDSWSSGSGETRMVGVSSDSTRVVTTLSWYGTSRTFFRNTPVAP